MKDIRDWEFYWGGMLLFRKALQSLILNKAKGQPITGWPSSVHFKKIL